MGCDIHLHVEIRINDKWEHYNAPDVDRNYALFSKLAGVRGNGSITPVAQPRGLPYELSAITQMDADYWTADGHSYSWLDRGEIWEVEDWWDHYMAQIGERWHCIEQQWGYLFGNALSDTNNWLPGIQDVRIVFWFDN